MLVNDRILLDAGYDVYEQIKRKDLNRLEAVVVSHEHPDHLAGLPDLDQIYNRKKPLKLFINKKTWSKVSRVFLWKKEIVFTEPFVDYKLGETTLTHLPVIHTDSSFGVLVEQAGKNFFYAPDMVGLPKETRERLQKADLIAFDGSSSTNRGKSGSHQSMDQGIPLAKELNIKQVYFTHIGHITSPHTKQEAKFATKNVKLAYDSLKLEI